MNVSNIAFLLAGLIAGLLALTGVLNAVKGTPVRVVKEFGDGQQPRWTILNFERRWSY